MSRDILCASPFFSLLKPDERDDLIALANERRFARGATLFNKGDSGTSMMLVLSGHVRVGTVSLEGREITLNLIGPGEILGEIALLDGKPRSVDATAADDVLLLVIERRHFLPLLFRHEGLVERMLCVLCDRLRKTSAMLEELTLFDFTTRLARLLVKLGDDYGSPIVHKNSTAAVRIGLKVSQRDLSTMVASTRESVNKQLRIWRDAGIVELRAGHVILLDHAALRLLFEA